MLLVIKTRDDLMLFTKQILQKYAVLIKFYFLLSYQLKSYCMIVYNQTFFELNTNSIIGCL